MPRNRQTLALTAVLAACVALTACGGSGSPSPSAATAHERSEEQTAETKFQDFAKCLREHGVNAEAVSRPGGAHGLKISPGIAKSPAGVEAADKACARYRPEEQRGTPSPQQKAELDDALQRFAKCMREHGIKVQASASGGIFIHSNPGSGEANPEGPAFKAAQGACRKLLPDGGP